MTSFSDTEGDSGELYAEHLALIRARFESALDFAECDRLLIFAGQELAVPRDDQFFPFRADPYFVQCVPLTDAPGSIIELVAGRGPRLCFMQADDYWHEPPADPSGYWVDHFAIDIVRSTAQARRWLGASTARTAAIGHLPPFDDLPLMSNDPALLARLDYYRAGKTRYEVDCMRRATQRAVRGHTAVARRLPDKPSEFALHETYCEATQHRETELPYSSIVALNEHASVLHYQNLRREAPSAYRSLLIDAGASHAGYASDITRTYAHGDGEFRLLIESMNELQQTICADVRSGVDFVALNDKTHRLLAAVMVDHGLVRCGADQAHSSGLTTAFLPHGLGHLLGLQVHDVGGKQISPDGELREPPEGHPSLRLTRLLEAGQVLTVEPGIYFIPTLLGSLPHNLRSLVNWDAVNRLVPYGGIRIEDNLLVESQSSQNLTRTAFASR